VSDSFKIVMAAVGDNFNLFFYVQKLQKVGQGVMRLAIRKARKDVPTKPSYICLQVNICF
jgi:hypothetical protein